jgi:hypothetical protein
MRTPAGDAALSAFIDAATSDADPDYPHGAAFIPWQETPQTDRILWRYLHEGRPAVIVGTSDFDMLIEPIQLGCFRPPPQTRSTANHRRGLLSPQGSAARSRLRR